MGLEIQNRILPDVPTDRRRAAQEEFGRRLIGQRDQMALLVRKWIETDAKFPIPIHDRLLDRIRGLDAATRSDVASVSLLMADQIVMAILAVFAKGTADADGIAVDYAIIAQIHKANSDDVMEQLDVNRGRPIIAIWNEYKAWLSRYSTATARAPGGGPP
jgi:hypothetical protein